MTMNDLSTLIANVGFPIAAFFAMLYQNTQMNKYHREESERWAKAIDANTQVMTELKMAVNAMIPKND